MSQIIKSFLAVFLILFLTAICMGIFSCFFTVIGAQNLLAQMVEETEESHFDADVMAACFAAAERSGGSLTVTFSGDGSEAVTADSAAGLPADTGSFEQAKLELTFLLSVPIYGLRGDHTIAAYAL